MMGIVPQSSSPIEVDQRTRIRDSGEKGSDGI